MQANILQFGVKAPPFDRRRFPRATVPHIMARPRGEGFRIVNMSRRGMAIEAAHPFSIGGSYLFELADQGRSLIVEGEIRWCQRTPAERPTFRIGVGFVSVQARETRAPMEHLLALPAPAVQHQGDEAELAANRIKRLETADSPDEAAELLLELLSSDFEHLVLFRIVEDEIRAWLGRGPTLVPERLKKLRLDLEQASIFLHLREGGHFFYGMLPAMFAHLQLLRCWNGSLQRECVLFPVRLAGRLVAVLYADAGDQGLRPEHLGNLQGAAELFTQSLLDQILRRKMNPTEPPG